MFIMALNLPIVLLVNPDGKGKHGVLFCEHIILSFEVTFQQNKIYRFFRTI